jgi:membrane protease YdiL (CAAX protease family)
MKSFIRNLPAPAEFFIVVSLWFDPLLLSGCFLLPKFLKSGFWEVSNASTIRSAIFQVMALAALIWIGNIRGWSLRKFGTAISWKGTGGGILLAFVSYAASYGVWAIYTLNIHAEHPDYTVMVGLTLPAVIASQIVNSVFEEVVEAGYFIYTFSRFGMWLAILASASLRMLYHVPWVGIEGLLGIFAAGLVSGFAYWRWRQLWPLVLAHTLRNLYYFLYAVHHAA